MKFYVYAILVDGKIKYIGKGKGDRVRKHMKVVHRIIRRRADGEVVRTTHFYNKLAKAWRAGSRIEERILHADLKEKVALKLEIKEIAKRRKQLWNVQPGGEHMDWNDPHFREIVTRKMRKVWKTEKRIARHLELMRQLHSDPQYKAMLSKRAKELNARPDMKAALVQRNKSKRMRDRNKRENWSPERLAAHKERLRLINEKRWADPANHIMSEKQRRKLVEDWKRPERLLIGKRHMQLINKKRWSNPKNRKQMSKRMKVFWADPINRDRMSKSHLGNKSRTGQKLSVEERAKISAANAKYWANPEARKQQSERIKRIRSERFWSSNPSNSLH